MARIFITGSSDGIGLLAAQSLIAQGHQVVLHARNESRRNDTLKKAQGAIAVLTGDLSNMGETKSLADGANRLGPYDAVIHNAGVYNASSGDILAVNVIAPYLLTCLIEKPKRLIYISSDMHTGGIPRLEQLRKGNARISYSDSKLFVLMLSKAVARKWPEVYSNAVDPGWIPTKMGGMGAPGDLQKGYETQVWLSVSDEHEAKVSGQHFHHKKETYTSPDADEVNLQEMLLEVCSEITGVYFPV